MFLLRKAFRALDSSLDGRYAIVILATWLVEATTFALALKLPYGDLWAISIATPAAFVVNYAGHILYTFRETKAGARKRLEFLALKLGMVGLRNILYWMLIVLAGLGPWGSYAIVFCVGFATFVGSKMMVGGVSLRQQAISAWGIALAVCKFCLRLFGLVL
jgi:putative flippase GtrA